MSMRFGVQTYTIRRAQKKDLDSAYRALAEMGIRDLEIARIRFDRKNALAVREAADRYGIRVAAVQVKPKYVFGNPREIAEFCEITGCQNVVISMLPFSCILGREERFYRFVDSLDSQYELYRSMGLELAYHHHNWEYVTLSNGKMRMDELMERTKKIRFVHDTYWTTKCGLSSPEQIRQFGERLLGIHLRDLVLYKKGLKVLSKDAAVGEGLVDFECVLKEAEKNGCSYYVIEQKTDIPYEKIKLSFCNCLRIKEEIGE